jgi:hypothetical protein
MCAQLLSFLSLLIFCCSTPALAPDALRKFTWQKGCVGQLEFELPGEVYVPIPHWADVLDHRDSYAFLPSSIYNRSNSFLGVGPRDPMFTDDVYAWRSRQSIEGSPLFPGPEMTLDDFGLLRQGIAVVQGERKAELVAELHPEEAEKIKEMSLATKDGFIWAEGLARTVFLWRGGHTFLYRVGGADEQKINARVKHIVEDLRSRDTFEAPPEQGLCVQGGFLHERNNPSHVIGVTYRLKEHPEVEIYLEEKASPNNLRGTTSIRGPAEEVRFFWEANYGADDKQHKLIHPHIPGVVHFPDVTIGGYKGKSSFVELTHQDDSIDYGYMAYAIGEAANDRYPPTLMLYVVRTAKRAIGEPLSKDQIKEMAEHIAASIRRRTP